jgi:hypothetical protein
MVQPELRLKSCNVAECEAMCCHDGVYLSAGEEQRLKQLVDSTPQLRARLPVHYVIDGSWNGRHLGRKTATRPHAYRNPDWPAHFPRTRCVFADEAGLCELQKLGLRRRQHAWRYKPFTCWMFPLDEQQGQALPPTPDPQDDPYRTPLYPGFVSVVPCGRHDAAGKPWRAALAGELEYFERVKSLPEFGSIPRL